MKSFLYPVLPVTLLVALSWPVAAQQRGETTIKGRVADDKKEPVPFATVTLLKAADSALVKGAVTDGEGHYSFSAPRGKYVVSASSLGMGRVYSALLEVSDHTSTIAVPVLQLKAGPQALRAVSVTAAKPFIVHETDKTVVNVENSIVSAGSNAWEVLEKSPGVSVDNGDNSIRLEGKTGVVIYIDGRPSHLSKDQLADMLKNMNASGIARIEIMTQPSSKFDAAGNAGIINIVTKKSKQEGFNGSLTTGYTQGRYGRENAGTDLNYRNGRFNLYGNYDFTHAIWWNNNYITRNFHDGPGKTITTRTEQRSSHRTPAFSHNFKAGLDYYLDKKSTIGFMMNGNINHTTGKRNNTTWFKNPDGSLQSTNLTLNPDTGRWTNYTYDLNYRGKYDSLGRELDVDVAYSRFDNSSVQHYHTDTYSPNGALLPNPNIRRGSIPSIIDIRTAKIDYTLPLTAKTTLEFGAKYSLVTSDNDVRYDKFNNQTGTWLLDSATNHFSYRENINAAYLTYKHQFKKGWNLQLGLRGEQTVSKGHQFSNDSTFRRNYLQLFPTAYLNKKLDKNNALNFSYSRRIDRPDYQSLNPFRYYLDPYTYEEGNPFLQPQLTNSIKLSWSYKSLFSIALSGSHTSDVMSQVLKQDDSAKITYQTNENLSSMQNAGIFATLSVPVTSWWMSNDFINVFYNKYKGEFLGGRLNFGSAAWNFNSTNTFTLPEGFTLELSGYYQSRALWDIFTVRPRGSVSLGVAKSLFHKKADLKLNINDIFHTDQGFVSVRYQNLDITSLNHWDSRRLTLTFTYRFHQGNVKAEHHHQSAIEDEQNRIKK
jgi:hypothetical protein